MVKELDNEKTFVEQIKDGVTVVDFWAVWCGPCRIMNPIIKSFAEENEKDLKVLKVNVDDFPEIAAQYQIMSIPTIMIFKNGEPVGNKIIGVAEKFILQENVKNFI